MRLAIIYLGFNNPRKHKRGVENVIEIQAKSLGSSCRKYYIFFDTESSTSRWGDITAIGVRYSLLRFLRTNLIIWRLRRRLRRRGYRALVHSHHYLTATFLWWMTDVFSVHDGLWYQKRMVGSRIPWFFFLVEKWVYWRARNLQCNSGFTLKNSLLVETGREVRIVFCSTPLERNRQLGLDKPLRPIAQGETMVFSVRSIEKRARIDLILDVADRANQRGLHLVFLIAGTGPLFHEYCQQVQERGLQNVRLLGYVCGQRHCPHALRVRGGLWHSGDRRISFREAGHRVQPLRSAGGPDLVTKPSRERSRGSPAAAFGNRCRTA
jgi:glycosyltransferase involved in cell wall biosynthesis